MEDKDLYSYAQEYRSKGFQPTPLPKKGKKAFLKEWTKRNLTDQEMIKYFKDNDNNIGLKTGACSNNLVDVDLDSEETRMMVERFLPDTPMISGRKSAPKSHYFYECEEEFKYKKFIDPENGDTILELRKEGRQTMVPPSIHPSGEKIEWSDEK